MLHTCQHESGANLVSLKREILTNLQHLLSLLPSHFQFIPLIRDMRQTQQGKADIVTVLALPGISKCPTVMLGGTLYLALFKEHSRKQYGSGTLEILIAYRI